MKTYFATISLFLTSLFYSFTLVLILGMAFWLLYNWLVPIYFAIYLPVQFVHIPLLDFIGLIFLITFLKTIFLSKITK